MPGASWTYRTVIQRHAGTRVTSRAEQWTYRVVDIDHNDVATLRGRLTGFGAGIAEDGSWDDDDDLFARARDAAPHEVVLSLGSDGTLAGCSLAGFGPALPHRALAVRVPALPAAPHEEWPLPALAQPFADLLPSATPADSTATGRLIDIHRRDDVVVAMVETVGAVRLPAGPAVHLSGTATWDTARGALVDRFLSARFTPQAPDPASDPGRLTIHLARVGWQVPS